MITGHISQWRSHPGFENHPVWREVFEWIEANAAEVEEGFHELESEGCYVRVMSYATKTREAANYESHRHTIDLQYSIEGGEGIEVSLVSSLQPKGKYLEEKDFQYHETPQDFTAYAENREGHFSVLFPEDAHQPQRLIGDFKEVKKLVVKIPVSSL